MLTEYTAKMCQKFYWPIIFSSSWLSALGLYHFDKEFDNVGRKMVGNIDDGQRFFALFLTALAPVELGLAITNVSI